MVRGPNFWRGSKKMCNELFWSNFDFEILILVTTALEYSLPNAMCETEQFDILGKWKYIVKEKLDIQDGVAKWNEG